MSDVILMSKPHFEFGNTATFDHSSLSMPNKISHPVKAQSSDDADPQSNSRAIAKIASLERNIERLNHNHASVLKDLYAEVEKLQNTISDLTLKKSVKSGNLSSCNDLSPRKVDAAKDSMPAVNSSDSHESIYILLQEQKNKYRGIIDRLSHDNKRKTNAIELLKNQLDLIKKALSLAGLELDMKELQSLVSNRIKEKADYEKYEENGVIAEKGSELVPRPPVESDPEKTYFSLSTEKTLVKKTATLEETQSQITKSYIEQILAVNRESTITNHENITKKEIVIKSNKPTKEAPEVSLKYQESIQEVPPVAEPPKSIFNQKEPLPPIHIEDKDQANTQEMDQRKFDALVIGSNFEEFETASLNRWKNHDDPPMATENQSILELLNGNKSIISDRAERKQRLKSKGL